MYIKTVYINNSSRFLASIVRNSKHEPKSRWWSYFDPWCSLTNLLRKYGILCEFPKRIVVDELIDVR